LGPAFSLGAVVVFFFWGFDAALLIAAIKSSFATRDSFLFVSFFFVLYAHRVNPPGSSVQFPPWRLAAAS
jgi:hypothetical protein